MKDMKLEDMGILENHLGLTFAVVAVLILLVGSLAPFSTTAMAAEDDGDEVEAPEWNEGDKWRYSDKIPMPGQGPGEETEVETIMEKEVTDENFEVNAFGPDGDKKTYETYQVKETHNVDDPENRQEINIYRWKENLAQIYNDPEKENSPPSAYHPPIIELDFPLYVDKEWSTDRGYDNQYDPARYFEDPPDPDEGDYPEADREYAFLGRVENKTTKEIELEKGFKVFETYMVNLTVLAYDKETGDVELNRYEMYYSPEVKNLVHVDIFGIRQMPEDQKIGDGFDIRQTPVGNETLLSFETSPYNPDDDGDNTSMLGVGVVLLILGVGTASILVYKKVKSSF